MRSRFPLVLLATALLAGCSQLGRIHAEDAIMNDVVTKGVQSVREAQAPAGTDFRFVVFGDSRDGLDVLHEEVKLLNAERPAFGIYTGDLVGEGTEAEWKAGIKELEACRFPLLPAPGNHERKRIDAYARYIQQPLNYAVDYGGWRFVSFDNSVDAVTDEQLKWLTIQLATAAPTIVFAHEPPLMKHWTHGFSGNARAFNDLLARHPNCKAALFGHMHLYDHDTVNGIPYVICGGGGAPIDDTFTLTAADGYYGYNYLVCEVHGDKFSYQMHKYTGIPIRKKPPRTHKPKPKTEEDE